jgi:hypothetical protein
MAMNQEDVISLIDQQVMTFGKPPSALAVDDRSPRRDPM